MKYVSALIVAILLTAPALAQNYTVEFERVFENGDKITGVEPLVGPIGQLTHLVIIYDLNNDLTIYDYLADTSYTLSLPGKPMKTLSFSDSVGKLNSLYVIYEKNRDSSPIYIGRFWHEQDSLSYTEMEIPCYNCMYDWWPVKKVRLDLRPVYVSGNLQALEFEVIYEWHFYYSTQGSTKGFHSVNYLFAPDLSEIIENGSFSSVKQGNLTSSIELDQCSFINEYGYTNFCDSYDCQPSIFTSASIEMRDGNANVLALATTENGAYHKLFIDDFDNDPTYEELIYQGYAKPLDGEGVASKHIACYSFSSGPPERLWQIPANGITTQYYYEPENVLVGQSWPSNMKFLDAATGNLRNTVNIERRLEDVNFFTITHPSQSLEAVGRIHDTIFIYNFDSPTPVYEPTDQLPSSFRLAQNYPNPFNPSTTISYELAKPAQVELTIYNIIGQEVTTLVDQTKPAGRQAVEWNGKDKNGKRVGSGMYLYRLRTDSFSETKKMLLLK